MNLIIPITTFLKNRLKQIMFDQEIIHKNQVNQLHRFYARCELFPMKRTFAGSDPVGSTRFVLDQDFSSRFHHRNLDLRLSTGNSCYNDDDDDNEVNLSLSIGRSTNKKSKISRKSWKDMMLYTSSRHMIDLDESLGTRLNEEARQKCTVDVAILHQDHLKVDPCMMNSDMHQEWISFDQGGLHDVKHKIPMDLDLNIAQPEESSIHSNEPLGPYPSSDGSYRESCSKISTSIPILKQPKSQINAKDNQTKICIIDLESLPEPSSDLTEEQEESDYSIQKAALSLISISLQQTLTSNQDSETKSGSNKIENIEENKKKTTSRSSSIDSYESLVLKLEESSIEEDSATSKGFEINELDQKESGIKLRRGRRLKDFQKDILPTLSSLTRHEIWEDINILEGVIRSREYKRLHKSKSNKGETWLTPVKSKRSKVKYVGQKCSLRKRN